MEYLEMLEHARKAFNGYCKACPICDGRGCTNKIPGPGAKGYGDNAILNFKAWKKYRLRLDTIHESFIPDTNFDLFGHTFKAPIFVGPVGAVNLHYGPLYNDLEYNEMVVKGAKESGILAFTGDGINPLVVESASKAILLNDGIGIPTIKPWNKEDFNLRMEEVNKSNSIAVAMDVDAAGLPFLRKTNAGFKDVSDLNEIIKKVNKPFIVKGVLSLNGAMKALEAGASAIVVSNHGGRVLEDTIPTALVLKEISDKLKGKIKILVDGGIRSGADIFKALALGADGVLIARPYVTAVYGAKEEGVKILTEKLISELKDSMMLTGAKNLNEITYDKIRRIEEL